MSDDPNAAGHPRHARPSLDEALLALDELETDEDAERLMAAFEASLDAQQDDVPPAA